MNSRTGIRATFRRAPSRDVISSQNGQEYLAEQLHRASLATPLVRLGQVRPHLHVADIKARLQELNPYDSPSERGRPTAKPRRISPRQFYGVAWISCLVAACYYLLLWRFLWYNLSRLKTITIGVCILSAFVLFLSRGSGPQNEVNDQKR